MVQKRWQKNIDYLQNDQQLNDLDIPKTLQMVLDRWVSNNFPAVLASLEPAGARKKL